MIKGFRILIGFLSLRFFIFIFLKMPVISLLWITSLCVHVCVVICNCSMYKRESYQLFHHKDRKTENNFFSKSVLIELHYSLSSICHIYLLSCQILIWSCQIWDEKRLQWSNCAEESINAKQNSGILPVWSPLLHCLHVGFPVSCVSVWWGKNTSQLSRHFVNQQPGQRATQSWWHSSTSWDKTLIN